MNTRHLKVGVIAAATSCLFAAGTAQASDNVSVTVNATIVGVCKFFTSSPVINLTNSAGGIDPSSSTTASGNVAITYRCSNGTSPSFTVPATATVTCTTSGSCGTTSMAPTVSSSSTGAGTGLGSGKDQTLTVTGQITQANFQNMQVGSYQGNMTVSVSP